MTDPSSADSMVVATTMATNALFTTRKAGELGITLKIPLENGFSSWVGEQQDDSTKKIQTANMSSKLTVLTKRSSKSMEIKKKPIVNPQGEEVITKEEAQMDPNDENEPTRVDPEPTKVASCSDTPKQDDYEEEEEDDMVLPDPRQLDSDDEESHDDDDDDDSRLWYEPPSASLSMPLVVVHLERFSGYIPSDKEEKKSLMDQLQQALFEHEDDDDDDDDEPLSVYFEERVCKLFEAGMADHSDTLCIEPHIESSLKYGIVEYPHHYYYNSSQQSNQKQTIWDTSQLWRMLLQRRRRRKPPSSNNDKDVDDWIDLLHRLLDHVRSCNRGLGWKHDMSWEIRRLVQQHHQEHEWRLWKTEKRSQQLDQLYKVRETFHQRCERMRIQLERLQDEQDAQLTTMQSNDHDSLSLQQVDFRNNHSIFYAMDENNGVRIKNLLGLSQEEHYYNQSDEDPDDTDDDHQDDDGEDDEYDDDADDEMMENDHENTKGLPEQAFLDGDAGMDGEVTPPKEGTDQVLSETESSHSTPAEGLLQQARVGPKKKKKLLRRRQLLKQRQENAAQQAKAWDLIEKARAHEERLRALCPVTPKLLKTQAMLESLEKRLEQIDDLLESLQEEEWADEEKEGHQRQPETNNAGEMSLLDQILAMILGALPHDETTTTLEKHYRFIQDEHNSIIEQWKKLFGALPKALSSKPPPSDLVVLTNTESNMLAATPWSEGGVGGLPVSSSRLSSDDLRVSLGITDNDDDDWEDVQDWDQHFCFSTATKKEDTKKVVPKKVGGLRPGGRLGK